MHMYSYYPSEFKWGTFFSVPPASARACLCCCLPLLLPASAPRASAPTPSAPFGGHRSNSLVKLCCAGVSASVLGDQAYHPVAFYERVHSQGRLTSSDPLHTH